MPVEEYPTLPTVGERSGVVPADAFSLRRLPGRRRRLPRRRHAGDHRRAARGHRERPVARRHRPLPGRRPGDRLGSRHRRDHRDDHSARPGPHPAGGRQDLRQRQHGVRVDHRQRRPRADRVPGRRQDRHVAADQGQLPARQAALPRDRRELRGDQHRRARRGHPPRLARARARGGPRFTFTIDGLTLEAIGSEQAQASESIDAS